MSKNFAMVVGINGYHPNNFTPLSYAKHDAEAMQYFFLNEAKFDGVDLFTDDSPSMLSYDGHTISTSPSLGNLNNFLHEKFERPFLAPGDNYWFFFAGHGSRGDNNRDYIMPIDANSRNVEVSGIEVNYIRERLTLCGADNVILVIDACRIKGARDGMGIGGESQPGVVTFYSCSPNQKAWEAEDLRQGVFTHALLEALRSTGKENYFTPARLNEYLKRRVPELCKHHGKVPEQFPSMAPDPSEKQYFCLLPQLLQPEDVQMEILKLKTVAYSLAFCEKEFDRAEQVGNRLNILTSGRDQEVSVMLRCIAEERQSHQQLEDLKRQYATAEQQTELLKSKLQATENSHQLALDQAKLLAAAELRQKSQELQQLLNAERHQRELLGTKLQEQEALLTQERQRWRWLEEQQLKLNFSQPQSNRDQLFSFEVVFVNKRGEVINRESKQARYRTENLPQEVALNMVHIPGGKFLMGSPDGEGADDEKPQHLVTVPDFLMGKYPITQAQWRSIESLPPVQRKLKPDPSGFKGDQLPVERVSWDDAVEFCARLTQSTGRSYRLPSEAEWEYACRASALLSTPFHFGETITTDLANYDGNSIDGNAPKGKYRQETTIVGSFPPNAFGLYDMHGNVWEWCADHWHDTYAGAPIDGSIWKTDGGSNTHLLRGGSWHFNPDLCRSAYRFNYGHYVIDFEIGFRVVCGSERT